MAGLFGGGKSTVNEAERISQFQVNQATYGEVVPIVFGTTRISGNIIDYFNFVAVRHEETQSAGKGGKTSTTNVTYTYNAAVLIGLCEGPIDGIGTVWKDTDTVTTLAGAGLTLFNGAYGQAPWSYALSSAPTRALPYSGLAYAAGYIELNSSAGVPTLNFEVQGLLRSSGDGTDCNPAAVLMYILGDSVNGIGLTESDVDRVCLQNFWNYCAAADLYISLPATDQTVAYEIVNTICEALNTIVFWSQDGFKLVPRCDETITGHGVTYAPDLTPLYDLDEDDFIADDDGRHVRFERSDNADAYNQCQVEFINRANSYETETTDYQVSSDVNRRGLRPMSKTYHFFHTKARASYVAQMQATQSCFNRLTYLFRLGWTHCLLEPGDLVSLTVNYGPDKMDKVLVRIETFKELQDEDGFDVTATPVLAGTYAPAKYATYEAERAAIDYQVSPGNVNQPIIFEPPDALAGGLVVWAGVSGGANWGGCDVWISSGGSSYKKLGTIPGKSKQGVLTAALPMGTDPDEAAKLSVDLSMSVSSLNSATKADADEYNTLCYVDGELISFETATLTDSHKYDLSYLRRGAYGTEIKAHNAQTQFMRIDTAAIMEYPFTEDRVGQTIYLKFPARNIFGVAEQSLADVEAFEYTLKGSALFSALPKCKNLTSYYQNGHIWLKCDAVEDFRAVVYEWRLGSTWKTATILGTTSDPVFQTVGDGTYWVCAKSAAAYSAIPAGVEIEGSVIAENVIASFDERISGWKGVRGGGASVTKYLDKECVNLVGAGLFSKVESVGKLTSVLYSGGIAAEGTYEVPAAHVVDIGVAQYCNVAISYKARISSPFALFSQIQSVGNVVSFIGNYSKYGSVITQIAVAGNDGVFGEWQAFNPGQYFGRKFKARAVLKSTDTTISAYLLDFVFSVDVPDRMEQGNGIVVPAEGLTIVHEKPFLGMPNTQITILAAQANDDAILTEETLGGFTVQIKNNGSGVARAINWLRKGY